MLLLSLSGAASVVLAQPLQPPLLVDEPIATAPAPAASVDPAQDEGPPAASDAATDLAQTVPETPPPVNAAAMPDEAPPLPPGAAAIQAPTAPATPPPDEAPALPLPPGAAAVRAPSTAETSAPADAEATQTTEAPIAPGAAREPAQAPSETTAPLSAGAAQNETPAAAAPEPAQIPSDTAAETAAPAAAVSRQGETDARPAQPASAADDAAADSAAAGDTAGFFSDIAWNGFFKNETAYRIKEPRSITKMRNIAGLTGVYSFNPRYRLTGSGWIYYDMAYDVYDYDTIVARLERNSDEPLTFLFNLGKEKDSFGADLREFYLDMMYDSVDIRLGRQLLVWGVLEGVRIVDEINPQDFRELIMPDLLDYRIPLWMTKVDWYRDEGTWQFLWIPDIRFHKPAPPGSEWELLQEVPGTIYPDSWDLRNSEYGVRLSTTLWEADVTFSYFYTWDDFPVIFRRILLNTLDTDMQFLPTFTRMTMYGSTATRQVGPVILKGEAAYVTGKYFAVDNVDRNGDGLLDSLGEVERDHIRWGLGVEFNWKGMDISPGVTQWIIPEYDPAMVQDQVDTSINLFLRKEYPRSSMLFELLAIRFINLSELYVNPEWTFFISDRFQIATGVDLFSGKKSQFGVLSNPLGSPTVRDQRSQFVGNFHDNDRFYIEFTYSY